MNIRRYLLFNERNITLKYSQKSDENEKTDSTQMNQSASSNEIDHSQQRNGNYLEFQQKTRILRTDSLFCPTDFDRPCNKCN